MIEKTHFNLSLNLSVNFNENVERSRRGRHRIILGFTTTYGNSAYHH
jgi:hypothetical protein